MPTRPPRTSRAGHDGGLAMGRSSVPGPPRLLKWFTMTTALSPLQLASGRRRVHSTVRQCRGAITLVAMVIVVIGIAGCGDKGVPSGAMPPVPVLAAKAVIREVPNQLRELGTVEAFAPIAINAPAGSNLQTRN